MEACLRTHLLQTTEGEDFNLQEHLNYLRRHTSLQMPENPSEKAQNCKRIDTALSRAQSAWYRLLDLSMNPQNSRTACNSLAEEWLAQVRQPGCEGASHIDDRYIMSHYKQQLQEGALLGKDWEDSRKWVTNLQKSCTVTIPKLDQPLRVGEQDIPPSNSLHTLGSEIPLNGQVPMQVHKDRTSTEGGREGRSSQVGPTPCAPTGGTSYHPEILLSRPESASP